MDPYQMTIGYRVAPDTAIPEGLRQVTIPAQKLAVFQAEGAQPQTLVAQWQAIWNGDLNRAYAADFDVYDANRKDRVVVHVGIST